MKRVLVCHDGTAIATRGITAYVQAQKEPCVATVFHVLEPFPPALLEHGGGEVLEKRWVEKRQAWTLEHIEMVNKVLQPCLNELKKMGHALEGIALKVFPATAVQDFPYLLKLEVDSGDYNEVLIVHHHISWLKDLLHQTWTDRAKRKISEVPVRIISCSEESGFCEV